MTARPVECVNGKRGSHDCTRQDRSINLVTLNLEGLWRSSAQRHTLLPSALKIDYILELPVRDRPLCAQGRHKKDSRARCLFVLSLAYAVVPRAPVAGKSIHPTQLTLVAAERTSVVECCPFRVLDRPTDPRTTRAVSRLHARSDAH